MQLCAKTTCTAAIFSFNIKTLKLVSLLPVWKHRQEDSHIKQVKKTYYTIPHESSSPFDTKQHFSVKGCWTRHLQTHRASETNKHLGVSIVTCKNYFCKGVTVVWPPETRVVSDVWRKKSLWSWQSGCVVEQLSITFALRLIKRDVIM